MTICQIIDTNDEWIQERTGIQERRHIIRGEDTTTSMGVKAAEIAIERSGLAKEDIDFVVFATLSPDYYFPGPGVLVQRDLGLRTVGALDVRNQCSIYLCLLCCGSIYKNGNV
jgi:3-oxoacyl-[acyl-carrier-protein] synthase-3